MIIAQNLLLLPKKSYLFFFFTGDLEPHLFLFSINNRDPMSDEEVKEYPT